MLDRHAMLFLRHIESRRKQTDEILSELGFDALLIHSGRSEVRLFDDQGPPFRASSAFVAWVPQPFAEDSLLEIRVGEQPRLWFYQADDFWHVPPDHPAEWWAKDFEVQICRSPEDWAACFSDDRSLAVIGRPRDVDDLLGGAALNPAPLIKRLDEMRTRKSEWEVECISEANQIAVRAHQAAAECFDAGGSELDIHLAYLAAAGQDQDHLPYNSIVALNEHAAVLHYQHRSPEQPKARRSFLIDAGANYHGYSSDITRTWAADGADDFKHLIEAVDQAQLRIVDQARAGQCYVDLHREAHLAIATVLEQFGIVRMTPAAMVESGVSGYFLPHGLGHFLGIQVHDVAGHRSPQGEPLPPPDQHPALRLTRKLERDNVITIEPGLYFIPVLLEKLKARPEGKKVDWGLIDAFLPFGGIRIEDNVLVTEAHPVNMTRNGWA